MITLNINEIHEFLKSSKLYKEIVNEDTTEIPIDDKFYLKSIEIKSIDVLIKMLEMCRYWMVDDLPHQMYEFIMTCNDSDDLYNNYFIGHEKDNNHEKKQTPITLDLKSKFMDYPPILDLCFLADYKSNVNKWFGINKIISTCSYGLVEYLWINKDKYNIRFSKYVCNEAAKNPDVRVIKIFHKNKYDLNAFQRSKIADIYYKDCAICVTAVEGGLYVLKYVHKNSGCHNAFVILRTLTLGKIDCLNYCLKHGFNRSRLNCSSAVKHFECFKYIYDNMDKFSAEFGADTYRRATITKSHDVVKYLYKKEYPNVSWDFNAINGAVYADDFEMVRWLHERGCDWNQSSCAYACTYGCSDILKYMVDNGCELDIESVKPAIYKGHLECLKFCIEYLKKKDIVLDGLCDAEYYGSNRDDFDLNIFDDDDENIDLIIDCLSYVKDQGYKFTYNDIESVSYRYQYKLLKYIYVQKK